MATLAAALKHEIRRLARREVRAETGKTKEAVGRYRQEIARLKRQMQAAEKKLLFFEAQERKRLKEQPAVAQQPPEGIRFSARSVAAQRKRLKLSAQQFARLLSVSSLTIYNWEHGRTRPRPPQIAALAAARELGRREAMAKLKLLEPAVGRPAKKPRKVRRRRASRRR
jgi:DNA-binding transcriptional regulator YiaG